MITVYEKTFDANEWFVIANLILSGILIWKLPKVVSAIESAAHFTYGIFIGMFLDHTISIKPWDFYDVNDTSAYQFIDLLSYIMYGPYSYIFIYLYVKWNIAGFKNILYITAWSLFAVLIEWVSVKLGVFHYNKGYQMVWSFPTYMIVQSLQVIFYHTSLKLEKAAE
ncbi:hypothetical protein DFO73_11224 [Cytobacillus oceanisediminis]|jgi:hypothetical protein|uniref:Uncharacterized protein n=1 Tax=Cytobacillus oceanisediminis TaxID=665099 RepID=A0A2V2ZTD1_9BACI|nr:hypothetical protein [Cytobacillus oceanisediminis]PWW25732.1 hypothetical protein DFO73_11224 [Cytobacillus oceanisediminis]